MMKRTCEPIAQQFNLSLVSAPATKISPDKQKELKLALIELLHNAACPASETQGEQGENHHDDDSQTNR
jgi:hypothetical protein